MDSERLYYNNSMIQKVEITGGVAGADSVNNKIITEMRGTPFAISTATTTTVKSGAGHLNHARVIGGTLANVTVYNSVTASGEVLLPTVTPVQNGVLLENIDFTIGLTFVTAGATIIVGSYR